MTNFKIKKKKQKEPRLRKDLRLLETPFEKCCAEYVKDLLLKHGLFFWCSETYCPKCNHYIGISPSPLSYWNKFFSEFNISPIEKEKDIENRVKK